MEYKNPQKEENRKNKKRSLSLAMRLRRSRAAVGVCHGVGRHARGHLGVLDEPIHRGGRLPPSLPTWNSQGLPLRGSLSSRCPPTAAMFVGGRERKPFPQQWPGSGNQAFPTSGSKLSHPEISGFGPCFHLPRKPFRVPILTHCRQGSTPIERMADSFGGRNASGKSWWLYLPHLI